ncbi:MAG: hypothetical protein F4X99_12090, partial [Gammaproteobacteria bacterium]|nr:hypothetical protein [Gammaproteobacteria bacterium]
PSLHATSPFTKLRLAQDKRRTMLVGATLYYAFAVGPIVLRLLEWFPANDSALLTPVLVAFGVASGAGGLAVVSSNSMMADVADEHELETGRRQEGIFFGALSFASKGAAGLGTLIGGLALDVIQFPIGAAPGGVDAATVFNLGAVYGPMLGVFVVFTVYCLMHYRLTEGRHAEIMAALAARPEETATGVQLS